MDDFIKALKDFWPLLVLILFGFLIFESSAIAFFFYKLFLGLLPFGAIILLGWAAWKMWVHYIQQDFISGIEYVLLEIVPPREVLRSPKAMELFMTNALYHFSNKGGKEEYWQGAVWFWFSLEIASIDGNVHFYIRTPTRIRGLIETQMYAQFPQAQVRAVEDYTLAVDEISPRSSWNAWGCEFKLARPEAFPLKTYIDFGLDKDPDEELKVDPVSPIVELFASIKKGEQMWLQIVVTPSKKTWKTAGTWFGTHDWIAESVIQIRTLLKPYTRFHENPIEPGTYSLEIRAPGFLDNVQKAMSAKTSKLGFETGIRVAYVAKKEVYDMSSRRNLRMIFRQFSKPDSNELERCNNAQGDALGSSIWSLSPEKVMILADRLIHEYRERAFFHLPMRHHLLSEHAVKKPFSYIVKRFFLLYFHHYTYVLNTEELATLWHFPGQIMRVPSLERIESKEASPPTNLPV